MKRICSVMIVVAMLIGMLPMLALPATAATYGDLTYTITDGEVTITDCATTASGTMEIPAEINGYPVTAISSSAFYGCTGLTSVTIPDGVTTIGNGAFYGCSGLTSVTIGSGVTTIDKGAFSGCTGLTSVNITDLSAWCKIAFGGGTANPLSNAKTLYLNGTLAADLVIPSDVTTISDYAFFGCTALASVTIPDSVTAVGNSVFSGCTGLTSVTIGSSVTTIGKSAFSGCTGLTSVTIPDSVTTIGDAAFFNCSGLTRVNIADLSAWCKIAFAGHAANPLYKAKKFYLNGTLVTDLVIPSDVTTISDSAFFDCVGLASVTIPDGVTTIGRSAFYGCTGLKNVTIPDSVTSIGEDAFLGCTGLTSVTIPDSVTAIGGYAFLSCTGLTSVTIPDSVTTIGNRVFGNCTGLQTVYYRGSQADRENMTIGDNNDPLMNATWHCESCIGSATHTYSGECDPYCNVCGEKREAPDHIYDSDKDMTCDECGFVRTPGDANGDGTVTVVDVTAMLQDINKGKASDPVLTDLNNDGRISLADALRLLKQINQ